MAEEVKAPKESAAAQLEAGINQGLEMMRQGQWEEAVSHFWSYKMERIAGKLGYPVENEQIEVIKPLTTRRDVRAVYRSCAIFSGEGATGRTVVVQGDNALVVVGAYFSKEILQKSKPELVARVRQNNALLHAEEWLHLWQGQKEAPLAGEDDPEIDVALFLQQKGIQLTPEFLSMHGRAEALAKKK